MTPNAVETIHSRLALAACCFAIFGSIEPLSENLS
jgi:hypothetical protein